MERKQQILHLTYDMGVGGTEQVITQLVGNLDPTRYENSIACIEGEIGLLGEALQAQGFNFLVFKRQPGFDHNLISQIRAALKRDQYDVIHCHQYTPFVYGVLAAVFTRTKVVFTEHGRFHPDRYSWKRRLVNPLLGLCTSSIVAISQATSAALAHYEWFSSKTIKVIYNGMRAGVKQNSEEQRTALGIASDEVVFGTIARFDSIKNLPMMVNGFREVCRSNPGTKLLLVGDGEERQTLERLVEEYDLRGSVIFAGYQKDTAKFMSVIDIYLLTSYSEGTSMTLLEAMSMGTCSIVTGVGGNVEIVEHGVSGIVVESEDVDDLTQWMTQLANDSTRRSELGREGCRVFTERFSIDKMVEQYSDIYTRITR